MIFQGMSPHLGGDACAQDGLESRRRGDNRSEDGRTSEHDAG